jgi:hypothetical protein
MNPMSISGVGNGSQTCQWTLKIPIAIPHGEPGNACLHNLTTPLVDGPEGKALPGLLGLRSMESLSAILDMGKQELILPGPGGVTIQVPPGSIRIPLEKAPSGHLVMVVDAYDEVGAASGLPPRSVHWAAFPQETTETPQAAPAPTQPPPPPPPPENWRGTYYPTTGMRRAGTPGRQFPSPPQSSTTGSSPFTSEDPRHSEGGEVHNEEPDRPLQTMTDAHWDASTQTWRCPQTGAPRPGPAVRTVTIQEPQDAQGSYVGGRPAEPPGLAFQ